MDYEKTLVQVLYEEEKRQAIINEIFGKDDFLDDSDFLAACYEIIKTPPKKPSSYNYARSPEYKTKRHNVKRIKSYSLSTY